ncbi:hypothetical protein [Pseudoalteromonas denitrificans]|uniref:Uncharacterized protein n=1 Tax=Pseudoalteromonas denitrificans DSM 6059 TaxID=1123010 RepID=A0A1I1KJF2_9GAMM|nr:hypothetical protein [Pseudoalteromonas denitrificans]SFC60791.1 hypothetical protein SAMN02745724_02080 [Pseudoalteromonas denitrificans DSM 6059]
MRQDYLKQTQLLLESGILDASHNKGCAKPVTSVSNARFILMLLVFILLIVATFHQLVVLAGPINKNDIIQLDNSHKLAATKQLKLTNKSSLVYSEIGENEIHTYIKVSPFHLMEYLLNKGLATQNICPSVEELNVSKIPVNQWVIHLYSKSKSKNVRINCIKV